MSEEDFLPYSEEPEVARKKVPSDERDELYKQGYWVNHKNEAVHVSNLATAHIINILELLWKAANDQAKHATVYQQGIAVENIINHVFLRDDFSDENGELSTSELDSYLESVLVDPCGLWRRHPFVDHALRALKARDVNYTLPWERELPF